jgi:hypothetical protein
LLDDASSHAFHWHEYPLTPIRADPSTIASFLIYPALLKLFLSGNSALHVSIIGIDHSFPGAKQRFESTNCLQLEIFRQLLKGYSIKQEIFSKLQGWSAIVKPGERPAL